jgi:hypothetical protein
VFPTQKFLAAGYLASSVALAMLVGVTSTAKGNALRSPNSVIDYGVP